MEEQATLTEEEAKPPSPAAESGRPPASVMLRTLGGVAVALVLALLLCLDGILWESTGYIVIGLAGVFVALALWEYGGIVGEAGIRLRRPLLVGGGMAFFWLLSLCWLRSVWQFAGQPGPLDGLALRLNPLLDPAPAAIGLLSIATLGLLAARVMRGGVEGSLQEVGLSVLGLVYVPLMFSFLIAIRVRWGLVGLVTAVAVCKITDTGAYYAGTLIGGPKLAPRVSPAKTIAGAVGAVLTATALAVALSLFEWSILSLLWAFVFGALMGPVAVIGDLAESLLKRQAGVKDSGVIPGFGGVLDMVDNVLFAAPFSYLFFTLFAQAT